MISRRGLLAGLMAGAALPLWAEAPGTSPRPARRPAPALPEGAALVEKARLGGDFSYVVADLASGRVLDAHEPDAPMPPASVAKTMTALFALERLGAAHRFETRVMAVGTLSGGRLAGDLVLVGGGDPTLDTDRLGDLAAALAASGLREVTGRLLYCATALPMIERIAADQPEQVGYNPGISGLNLNYNRVHFEWRRQGGAWNLAMDARSERFVPQVGMARMRIEKRDLPVFAYTQRAGFEEWSVAESALIADGSRWLPVRQPARYAAEVFSVLCAARGIRLGPGESIATLPADAVPLVACQSAPLADILRDMLKFSTNVTAEAVGLAASGAGTLRGSAATMSDWAGRRFGVHARFGDHSGLGAASRISAADMVRMLRGGRALQPGFPALLKDTALGDAGGRELAPPVRLHAKTGTLNFVSALAGYLEPASGPALAFAIFAADLPRRAALPLDAREAPPGGKPWAQRARGVQAQLLRHWAAAYR